MALAEQAELVARFSLQDNVSRAAGKIKGVMGGLSAQSEKLHKAFGKIGAGLKTGLARSAVIGAGAIAFLALQVRGGIKSLAELELAEKATEVVLRNRGKTTRLTAQAVRDLANSEEDLTTIDDKSVQAAENLILSYSHISDRIFPATIRAAEDLSVALGTNLSSASRTVAKALEDPAKGMTRLTRLGVIFTAQEQDQIKALVAHGKVEEAQLVILNKLNQMYGGRAIAAADSYAGSQNRIHDAVEEVQKSLATALLPALTKVSNKLSTFLKDPQIIAKMSQLGDTIAGLFSDENIEAGGKALRDTFGTLASLPWDQIKNGLQVSAAAAGKAVEIFKSLPPEVQGGLITLLAANKLTGGLVASGLKDLAGLALSSLKTITAGHVTVIGPVAGGTPGGGGGGPGGLLGPLAVLVTGAVIVKGTEDLAHIGDLNNQLLGQGLTQDELNALRLHQAAISNTNATRGVVTAANRNTETLKANVASGLEKLGLNQDSTAAEIQTTIESGTARTIDALQGVSHTTGRYGQLLANLVHPIVPGLDRLRDRASQIAHETGRTTDKVSDLVGIEKNRRTRINIGITNRNQFSVSGTVIAYELNRINRNGGNIPI